MKSTISKLIISLLFVCMFSVGINVKAATYSQQKNSTVTIHGCPVTSYETATYHTSGETRWTYSNAYLSSSANILSCGYASRTSVPYTETVLTAKTGRTHVIKVVDYNYSSYTGTATMIWTFDKTNNRFS